MKLIVDLNDNNIDDFIDGKKSLTYEIYLQEDDSFYPMKHWSDFGNAVLGSWVNNLIELLEGKTESEFYFLDGPYSVKVCFNPQDEILSLYPQGISSTWQISKRDFITELIDSFNFVKQKLDERKIGQKEQNYCVICAEKLSEYNTIICLDK
jgi:hypothetical protein